MSDDYAELKQKLHNRQNYTNNEEESKYKEKYDKIAYKYKDSFEDNDALKAQRKEEEDLSRLKLIDIKNTLSDNDNNDFLKEITTVLPTITKEVSELNTEINDLTNNIKMIKRGQINFFEKRKIPTLEKQKNDLETKFDELNRIKKNIEILLPIYQESLHTNNVHTDEDTATTGGGVKRKQKSKKRSTRKSKSLRKKSRKTRRR
jgi:hypothetical protein